jgi:IclR family pca regulon transcriptional regulator
MTAAAAAGAAGDGHPAHGEGPGVIPIQAVQRAALLLGLFTANEPELTLGEIAQRLAMPRATVHRYGMSLRSTGLLRYDAARATYSLGPRVIELGRVALANLSIIKIATPFMERLSERVNESVVLSVWDGSAPVVVNVADRTDRLVSIAIRAGSRLPLYTSAQGLLFLAYSASARAEHARDPELADSAALLETIRGDGYAVSDGVIAGITVAGAPVLQAGELVGTVAIVSQQSSGVGTPGGPAVSALLETAGALAAQLGEYG